MGQYRRMDAMMNVQLPSSDILETIASNVPVSKGHSKLIDALSQRGMDGIKFMHAQGDMFTGDCRVFDAAHNEVANNYQQWIKAQVDAVDGKARSVYEKYRESGYLLSETPCHLLFFSLPYGDAPGEFFQFEFYLSHEVIVRDLFDRHPYGSLKDADDLINNQGSRLDTPVMIAGERYSFRCVRDVAKVATEMNEIFRVKLKSDGAKIFNLTNVKSGETRSASLSEIHPEAYAPSQNCGAYRLLQDWAESSAGLSGAQIQDHWYFHIWDRPTNGKRDVGLIPGWTTTKKLAEVEFKPRDITDYAIYDKLLKIDQRVGVPFAWYFFMLHGNRVHSWAGKRIMEAVDRGLLVLPDHDYLVLRRWYDMQYGF